MPPSTSQGSTNLGTCGGVCSASMQVVVPYKACCFGQCDQLGCCTSALQLRGITFISKPPNGVAPAWQCTCTVHRVLWQFWSQ